MNKKIFNFFEIAARTAKSKVDERSFLLGCVAVRNDGAIVKALNSASELPNRQAHAEYRIASRIDYGATVYVARVRLMDGTFGMAKPCRDCMKILMARKVRKIYYTISQKEYGTIYFN
jgi:tRNA(Arg) A34 adenosine deaminase TadA